MQQGINLFTTYDLTVEERAIGYSLTPEQRAVIQNDIAEAAMQKIALKFDPDKPIIFAQKEAELQGRILILQYMLARADSATTDLTQELTNNLNNIQ